MAEQHVRDEEKSGLTGLADRFRRSLPHTHDLGRPLADSGAAGVRAAAGVYLVRLAGDGVVRTRKLLITR